MQFLIRQGDQWWFRRRVPSRLQQLFGIREIYRSLRTPCKKKAAGRAAFLFMATERLFRMADASIGEESGPTEEEIRGAVRYWLDDFPPWQRKLSEIRNMQSGELYHRRSKLLDHLTVPAPDAEDHLSSEDQIIEEAIAILEHAGYSGGSREPKEVLWQVHNALRKEVQSSIDKRFSELFSKHHLAAGSNSPLLKPSPMFAQKTEEFLADKTYSDHSRGQNRVTFRLWSELIGNMPCREYEPEDADAFRTLLLQMPSSHGKGGKLHAREAIEKARKDSLTKEVPLMAMKTVKRHFSALSQYWIWLNPRGGTDRNIFLGFSFPGTGSDSTKRDAWSDKDLVLLFTSAEWRALAKDKDSSWRWLPLVSLFSGLRLEEAARLRPEDVQLLHGVDCLCVQRHPDGWKPKTEAGIRDVPIHPALRERGFLDLVERRRKQGAGRLFTDLQPGGPAKAFGYEFSRQFSKLARNIGVGDRTTFHSFRHTWRTILDETDHETRFITMLGGWERTETDEGSRNYAKRRRKLLPKFKTIVDDFSIAIDLTKLGV